MTRRNVRKQGWVFPLISSDSDNRSSLKFHRFVISYFISCDTRRVGLWTILFTESVQWLKKRPGQNRTRFRVPLSPDLFRVKLTRKLTLKKRRLFLRFYVSLNHFFVIFSQFPSQRPGNQRDFESYLTRNFLQCKIFYITTFLCRNKYLLHHEVEIAAHLGWPNIFRCSTASLNPFTLKPPKLFTHSTTWLVCVSVFLEVVCFSKFQHCYLGVF